VVGVSQGGIIAMHYVKLGAGRETVRNLVTVASPFAGTLAPVAGLLAAPLVAWASRGLFQALPGSALLGELERAPVPPGVSVTSIAIQGDLISPPDRCRVPDARNVTVPGAPLVAHQWLILSSPVLEAVVDALRGRGGTPAT